MCIHSYDYFVEVVKKILLIVQSPNIAPTKVIKASIFHPFYSVM